LASLERRLRRQSVALASVSCFAVACVLSAAKSPPGDVAAVSISCRDLKVIDQDGKLRVSVGSVGEGSFGVACFDKDGKPRVGLGLSKDGASSVQLLDREGMVRISARIDPDGYALSQWFDQKGDARIVAGTNRSAVEAPVLPTSDLKSR
jgi:hypothetical protein